MCSTRSLRATFESLEQKKLLTTATFSSGTLTVSGDGGANDIYVGVANNEVYVEDGIGNPVNIGGEGAPDPDDVSSIVVNGNGGDDLINLADVTSDDFSNLSVRVRGGAGNDSITGSEFGDFLYGDAGMDTIGGRDGNDNIEGGAARDVLYGDDGADSLDGGSGNDDLFGRAGNDILVGGDGNDGIYGGQGNDAAYGGYGNDLIEGGSGNDTLFGDYGADTLRGDDGTDSLYAVNLVYSVDGDDDQLVDDGVDSLTYVASEDSLI